MNRACAAGAAGTLAAVLTLWPGARATVIAGGVVVAILVVWVTGSPGGASGRGWRRTVDRFTTAGLAASLASGTILAATLEGAGAFGLPRALWALVVGVFAVPLVLTTVGYALAGTSPGERRSDRGIPGAPTE